MIKIYIDKIVPRKISLFFHSSAALLFFISTILKSLTTDFLRLHNFFSAAFYTKNQRNKRKANKSALMSEGYGRFCVGAPVGGSLPLRILSAKSRRPLAEADFYNATKTLEMYALKIFAKFLISLLNNELLISLLFICT